MTWFRRVVAAAVLAGFVAGAVRLAAGATEGSSRRPPLSVVQAVPGE
jgi:hypothetical protein